MKKLLLIISSFCVFGVKAQSFEMYDGSGGAMITNNQIITEDVLVGGQSHIYVYIKNTSSSSTTYAIRRTDQVLNSGSEAYFCFGSLGTCFPPSSTTVTPTDYLTVDAGASSGNQQLYFDENGPNQGYSEIIYEFFNVNNTSDKITFTFRFNPLLSGIKENSALFSSVSSVYPNPSNNNAHIKLHSTANIKNASVSILNSLGSTVSSNTTALNLGDNTVRLDTESLPSGIYFATISAGKTKIVKKFVVNK